jgi:hypothetical protein
MVAPHPAKADPTRLRLPQIQPFLHPPPTHAHSKARRIAARAHQGELALQAVSQGGPAVAASFVVAAAAAKVGHRGCRSVTLADCLQRHAPPGW